MAPNLPYFLTSSLEACWYINILNATKTPPPTTPIPGSLVLLGSGLLGLRVYRKRTKK